MRHEISEAKQWRSQSTSGASQSSNWAGRRQTTSAEVLPADAVDEVFASATVEVEAVRGSRRDLGVIEKPHSENKANHESPLNHPDLIGSLSAQLTMLEAQHEQLSRLLAQAQGTLD